MKNSDTQAPEHGHKRKGRGAEGGGNGDGGCGRRQVSVAGGGRETGSQRAAGIIACSKLKASTQAKDILEKKLKLKKIG